MLTSLKSVNSTIKLPTKNSHFSLPLSHIVYTWFHLHFFTYRTNFFNKTYNLISSHISELQLTYMDNMWEKLVPLSYRKEKASTIKSSLRQLVNINLSKSKLTSSQLVSLVLKPQNFLFNSYISTKVSSKYINSYYNFLNTRVGFSRRNYIQRLSSLYNSSIKNLVTQSLPYIIKKKVKYLRRNKVRMLNKQTNNLKTKDFIVPLLNKGFTKLPNLTLCKKIVSGYKKSPLPFTKKLVVYRYTNIRKNSRKFRKTLLLRSSTGAQPNYNPKYLTKLVRTYYTSRVLRFYKKTFWLRKYGVVENQGFSINYKQLLVKVHPLALNYKLQNPLTYKLNPLTINDTFISDSTLQVSAKAIKSFIWRNNGFNIISKVLRKNQFPHKLKSQFKKKLFSFIYPGQSKKNVLIRRKKQVLTRLLSKSTKLVSSLDKFSYRLFYQLFTTEQFMLKKKNILQKNINQSILTYGDNLRNVYYSFDYNTKGIDVSDLYIHSEVRIPRVRFKPGYQRIWRQVRSALKISLNVKFQYQHQLTKYLTKFYHLSSQYLLSYSESTLDKIVIYSQLLPDTSTVELFSSHGFIYVNGNVSTDTNTILIKNDFIQLVVSLWYYVITRWFLNWTNARIRKFKRLVYRKNKPLQYKIMKNKKQQSYYTPNWIYQTRYDNTDVKPYLEVDFFSLSTFILTDTYIQYYHKIDDMPDLRNSTYILYNWKYIT